MNPPVCSVCIANYNGIEVIGPCLESVLNQEGNIPIEIIVHDDASSDGSMEYIQDHFPDVMIIPSEENVGFCVSNNRMVDKAKGEYILLLNNDAVLHSDALKTLYEYAEQLSRPSILGLPQYDMLTGDLRDMGLFLDPFLNPIPNKDPKKTDVGMVIGACMWMPRNLWHELGGFPEWFEYLAEDTYLCCIARLMGYSVIVIPRSGYDHWVGRSLGGAQVHNNKLITTYRSRFHSEKNKMFVLFICYPLPLLLIVFPLDIVLLTVEGIVLSIFKNDFYPLKYIYLEAIGQLWYRKTQLLRYRRHVQKNRSISLKVFVKPFVGYPYKLWLLLRHGVPELR